MKCLNKLFAFADRQSTTDTATTSTSSTNRANHNQQLERRNRQQLQLEQLERQTEERKQPQEGSLTLTSTLYAVTFVPDLRPLDSERIRSSSKSSGIAILADGEPVELKRNQLGAKTTGEEGRSPTSSSSSSGLAALAATATRLGESTNLVGYFRPAATIGNETIAVATTTSKSNSVSVTSATSNNRATIVVSNQPDQRQPRIINQKRLDYEKEGVGGDEEDYLYYSECYCGDKSEISVAATIEDGDDYDDDWILVDSSTTGRQQQSERLGQRDLRKQISPIVEKTTTTATASKLQLQTHSQQMALDVNSIELVKASWIPVRRDIVASGVLLFKGLFTKFPQYLKFFPQFVDLDLDSLQENKRLLRHAVKVIETVTFVVDSIGDETKAGQLEAALVNLVRGHLKRRIGLAEFRNLGIVLIDFICDINYRRQLKEASSSSEANDCNNEAKIDTNLLVAAWTKLYSSILDLVKREEGNSSD